MWLRVIGWIFGTPIGRTLLIAALLAAGLAIGHHLFSSYYYNQGVIDCNAKHMEELNKSNVAQANQNAASNLVSSDLGKEASRNADKLLTDVTTNNQTGKGKINEAYKAPSTAAPVAFGSCVYPVDDSVQDVFEQARRAANKARGS